MSCYNSSTVDVPVCYCERCGQLGEHGTGGCPPLPDESPYIPFWLRPGRVLRVMNDELFIVDPGSPPPLETCPTCGRER